MSAFPRRKSLLASALLAAPFLPSTAHAQRPEAKFEWQKEAAVISYGVPRVGKHSIDELQVGQTWRMGANDVTTLTTDAPLICADTVVPPGSYRVNLGRPSKDQFHLTIEGAGTRMAAGGDDVLVVGKIANAAKPNDKLEIAWNAVKEQPDPELRALELEVQFGAPVFTAPLTIVGSTPIKAKGFGGAAFKYPEAWLGERLKLAKHTPVLTLVRTGKVPEGVPEKMNLLVSENDAILLPTMKAPTENRGFGAIPQPDAAWILKGSATWTTAQKTADHFRVDLIETDKDVLHVVAVVGARQVDVKVGTAPTKGSEKGVPGASTPTKQ